MNESVRKFILLTLNHVESGDRTHYTPHFVVSKCRSLFNCESVVVAKELHKEKGYHYHVGIQNDTASRYTAARILRDSFPEFDGRQLNVSYHKSWNTICEYIFKQDKEPYCWGTTKEQCRERFHRKKAGKRSVDFVSRLGACVSWRDVITDSFLGPRVARSYSSVKQLFLDLKGFEELDSLESRLSEYLSVNERVSGKISGYSSKDLQDRTPAISWLGENLNIDRPIRTPQLLLIGPPGSGKTTFVDLLSKFCKVYVVPLRKDDFSRASTSVDFWFIDELTSKRMSPEVLNIVLDGSSADLEVKFGHLFEKRKNVPVIMACNKLPKYDSPTQAEALRTRVMECEFSSYSDARGLTSPRLAKTLLTILSNRNLEKIEENFLSISQ